MTTTATIKVDGMSCGGCSSRVGKLLAELPGVAKADVELASGLARGEFDAAKVGHEALLAVIRDAGFGASIPEAATPRSPSHDKEGACGASSCAWP